MIVDSSPVPTSDLPFANETEVQAFVEQHAQRLFGLRVIASSRARGRCLFGIDLLAIDGVGSPFIIECKWDLVDQSAVQQLVRYEEALTAGWSAFEARVKELTGEHFRMEPRKPVLVAVGYRYERSVLEEPETVVCLAYQYGDVRADNSLIEERRPGTVSIVAIDVLSTPTSPHPAVSKRHYTSERLAQLPPSLQEAFWVMDRSLRELDGITVVYGGKNYVRYRMRNNRLAEARIRAQTIEWLIERPGGPEKEKRVMRHESDALDILAALRDVHARAG